ncbi:GNAT family N-acetyltransferase [Thermoflavimicrobium dichotomicum]|uniref:Putative hemolysin n=1 Tax=Thermoflavimicrobium dichotomicum TaxID=46223 RepID=A0A1I3P5I5_9BACL|nr:GNAT family N-acyltransferase [Thermoflavimicrobium dichotomicum]SFJ16808.1 Putative hemolysin [Thermoflavimicrobium dichotomicum]
MATLEKKESLLVKIAETKHELEQTFRLRYQVFVEEANNRHLQNEKGIEQDVYDDDCDHLIVLDQETNQVIGTYRLLPGERAVIGKGFYSETEFDLSHFSVNKTLCLEVGRSCVAPEHRNGRVIQLLWAGIADYIKRSGHQYLIGCVSMEGKCKENINEIYSILKDENMITDDFQVRPQNTHRMEQLHYLQIDHKLKKQWQKKLPPLIKGYQWLGAKLAGQPAFDPVFQTIDFFVVLETAKITKRYQRRFLSTN